MSQQDKDTFDGLFSTFEEILRHPRILGLSPVFQDLRTFVSQEVGKYPPHNVIKHGENNWLVEVAVAGFTCDELDVEVAGSTLQITGMATPENLEGTEYIHRGVARRDFHLTFKLGERCQVGEASYQSGMLLVPIERTPPVKKMIRKISITEYDRSPAHDGLGPKDLELEEDQFDTDVDEHLEEMAKDLEERSER